jgi:hypothetical protein
LVLLHRSRVGTHIPSRWDPRSKVPFASSPPPPAGLWTLRPTGLGGGCSVLEPTESSHRRAGLDRVPHSSGFSKRDQPPSGDHLMPEPLLHVLTSQTCVTSRGRSGGSSGSGAPSRLSKSMMANGASAKEGKITNKCRSSAPEASSFLRLSALSGRANHSARVPQGRSSHYSLTPSGGRN